jgi:Chromate resistance exported protein
MTALRRMHLNAASTPGKKAAVPLLLTDRIPPLDRHGRTVWVTRARPKVDRIACPWLIRRFVDPNAVFLFVAAPEVEGVAERFGGAPFDLDGVFWSHRGERCTFDLTLQSKFLKFDVPILPQQKAT